jgi:hypothetical protein
MPKNSSVNGEFRFIRADGFLFAVVYAAMAVAACQLFPGHLQPRQHDIFLVGIVLTVYRFTWRPAALLLAAGLVISALANPSLDSLASFALVSAFLMTVMARLQTGFVPAREKAAALHRLQEVAGIRS